MCSLTSRVLFYLRSPPRLRSDTRLFRRFTPATLTAPHQHEWPRTAADHSMIRAPAAATRGLLWSVLTSCSVTFSQLRPSESNRDLYHEPLRGQHGPPPVP